MESQRQSEDGGWRDFDIGLFSKVLIEIPNFGLKRSRDGCSHDCQVNWSY